MEPTETPDKPSRLKSFVEKHKTATTVVATSAVHLTAFAAIRWRGAKLLNEFLVEKGIDPQEFYNPQS